MRGQLALKLPPEFTTRPTLHEVPRVAPVRLPRALRNAMAVVRAESPDGRAFQAIARFIRKHDGCQAVLPRRLRPYARRIGLRLGDGRK